MNKFKPRPLAEQTLVIIGDDRLGPTIARLASERGANVALAGTNQAELNINIEEMKSRGGKVLGVGADVRKKQDLIAVKNRALEEFGSIDTWINSAQTYPSLIDSDLEEERNVFEVNFWGTRLGSQVAVQELRRNGGVLVNLGSEISLATRPLSGIYSATKLAVKGFTESLRSELRDMNLSVEVCLVRPVESIRDGTEASVLDCAEAILKCAVYPQREIYVGGPARLSAIIDTFFPGIKDLMAGAQLREFKKGDRMLIPAEGDHSYLSARRQERH